MREERAFCDICGSELLHLKENWKMTFGRVSADKSSRSFHVCEVCIKKYSVVELQGKLSKKVKEPPTGELREIIIDAKAPKRKGDV